MTARHPRRPDLPRPASLSRRVSRKALAQLRKESADHPGGRPRTRGECEDGPRPCPWVSCRHHLYLEVNDRTVKINFPGLEIEELVETCALDVADRGGLSLEDVGPLINVTRERIRQIELSALAALPRDQLQELHDGEGARGRRHLPVLPPAPPKPPRPALPPPPPPAPSGYVPRRGAHDRAAILAMLESGPRRLGELADDSNSYRESITRQLRRLLADGLVERIALGVYALRARSAAE